MKIALIFKAFVAVILLSLVTCKRITMIKHTLYRTNNDENNKNNDNDAKEKRPVLLHCNLHLR